MQSSRCTHTNVCITVFAPFPVQCRLCSSSRIQSFVNSASSF